MPRRPSSHSCPPGCCPRPCVECGQDFKAKFRADQRYCSTRCQKKAARDRIGAKGCTYPGCDQRRSTSPTKYCDMHRHRHEHGVDMDMPKRGSVKVCTVEGCERKVHAKTMCGMHWIRMKKHGDPGPAHALQAPNGTGRYVEGYRLLRQPNGSYRPEHRLGGFGEIAARPGGISLPCGG